MPDVPTASANRVRLWMGVSLLWLVLVAAEGTLMRLGFLGWWMPFNLSFVTHSHSHVAMLGWVFNSFLIALLWSYRPQGFAEKGYRWLFWLIQATVAGMLVAFVLQGYAAFSITFSTVHILLSYWFIVRVLLQVLKERELWQRHRLSLSFVAAGLVFLFLSSFGPWGLAVLSAKGMQGSDLYPQAIYFYLHFLFNGAFTFMLLGLMLKLLEGQELLKQHQLRPAFWVLAVTTVPAYFLSLLGFEISDWLYWLALISGIIQLAAFGVVFLQLEPPLRALRLQQPWALFLLRFSLVALLLKFMMQAASPIPQIIPLIHVRDVVIGFLHLVLLGGISIGLLGWFLREKLVLPSKAGLGIFLVGFVLTELLLFLQGGILWLNQTLLPFYREGLFALAFVMLTGLVVVLVRQLSTTPGSESGLKQ